MVDRTRGGRERGFLIFASHDGMTDRMKPGAAFWATIVAVGVAALPILDQRDTTPGRTTFSAPASARLRSRNSRSLCPCASSDTIFGMFGVRHFEVPTFLVLAIDFVWRGQMRRALVDGKCFPNYG
jgi:hypothetical protein